MYEKLVNYLVNEKDVDPSVITPDATFEDLGLDSLDVVEMAVELEDELGVELEVEDQNITTFGEFVAFAESKAN